MGTIGTFGSFTQARLAIYASQMGLSVTGNNISNINTTGYTRQQLDQTSFRTGGADRYHSSYSIRVGNGVLTTGVSQLRDPYLDIRYRSQMSSVGAMDAKLGGLEDIQAIIDEVGDGDDDFGIIEAQLSDLYDALSKLSTETGQTEYDIQVRSSAQALVNQINSYANKLQEVYNNTSTAFTQDVAEVNSILTSIRDLNATIRKNEIHGDSALELKDERNQLIDQLSEYMKIDVTYEKEYIGAGIEVDKLVIKLGNCNPDAKVTTDSSTLIDGIYATQFSVPESFPTENPAYDPDAPTDPADPAYDEKTASKYIKTDNTQNPPVVGYTNDAEDADQISNDNLIMKLTALTDSKGKVLKGSEEVTLDDNDLYGALQSERELLTESGEFANRDTVENVDENAATKRGIPYYQNALNLLAKQIATAFNDANQDCIYNENGEYLVARKVADGVYNTDGETIKVTYSLDGGNTTRELTLTKALKWDSLGETPEETEAIQKAIQDALGTNATGTTAIKQYVEKQGGVMVGTPLFSNHGDSNDTNDIDAFNISISDAWSDGPQIVSSFKLPTGMTTIPTTDSSNIAHMLHLFSEKMDYNPNDVANNAGDVMFNGTFQEFWSNTNAVLGNDMKVTSTMLDTYYASSVNLDTSRSGVSGVDLNDEAMNLMQYSQSYNAACRLMTTIDSVLDKLINGTGA